MVYQKPNGKWYFSCCGKEFGGAGFSSEGRAKAALALHRMRPGH